jgi:hypothetical protein
MLRLLRRAAACPLTAPIAEQLSSDTNGPNLPFASDLDCCGAARHSRHSLQKQNVYGLHFAVQHISPKRSFWLAPSGRKNDFSLQSASTIETQAANL